MEEKKTKQKTEEKKPEKPKPEPEKSEAEKPKPEQPQDTRAVEEQAQREERHRRRMHQQRLYTFIALLVLLVILGGLGAGGYFLYTKYFRAEAEPAETQVDETPEDREKRIHARIEEILAEMSPSDKAAAMMIVTPEQLTGADLVKEDSEQLAAALQTWPVAGLVFDEQNFSTEKGLRNLLSAIGQNSRYPLFLAFHEGGGSDSALSSFLQEPLMSSPSAIAATHNTEEAHYAGEQIGMYMKRVGFNLNLAPVLHPAKTAMEEACFGLDGEESAAMYLAFTEGMQTQRILSAAGVFPAPGTEDAGGDPDSNFIGETLEELENGAFLPFQTAIEAGTEIIIVSNVQAPRATGDNSPCSLSESMITGQLRGTLAFQGVVMTDRFDQGVIAGGYTADAAAVNAILAGADIILCPSDFLTAHRGIMEALQTGVLTEERLDRSLTRILRVLLELE
ncbi:MAG: hypothetical protein IJR00_02595 [Lachnospiraceae bacterium]|nr:hypothetical protein [Lachnospiraceae bacterium]